MKRQIITPNGDNYKAILNSLRRFFILEVYQFCTVQRYTMRSLSIALEKNEGYVEKIVRQKKFMALYRLYEELQKLRNKNARRAI